MSTKRQHIWRKLARAFGPDLWAHRRLLLGAYAFRLISVGALIFSPWPLKVIIDNVIASKPLPGGLGSFAASLSPESLIMWMSVLFVAATVVGAVTNALEKNL